MNRMQIQYMMNSIDKNLVIIWSNNDIKNRNRNRNRKDIQEVNYRY